MSTDATSCYVAHVTSPITHIDQPFAHTWHEWTTGDSTHSQLKHSSDAAVSSFPLASSFELSLPATSKALSSHLSFAFHITLSLHSWTEQVNTVLSNTSLLFVSSFEFGCIVLSAHRRTSASTCTPASFHPRCSCCRQPTDASHTPQQS